MSHLKVLPKACDTCPYAKSTPPGVWDKSEYEKLPLFDDSWSVTLAVFMCHNGGTLDANDTVCRGWLSVHRDSVPVRLACARGRIAYEDVPEDLDEGLYASGFEACRAGLRGVRRPTKKATKATKAMDKILAARGRRRS